MKVVTITSNGFINSLPTSADKPGRFTGFTRDGVMRHVFELADAYHAEIRVAGQHWPSQPPRAAVARRASDKLGKTDIARRNRAFEARLPKSRNGR